MPFSDPEHNIEQFSLQSGAHVADFASGSGFYALAAAKAVGNAGRIYALDVQKDLLQKLKNEAERRLLHNIEVIWADLEQPAGSHLRENMLDAVIISNALFQMENKDALVIEAKRLLKPKGRVLVVDWADSFGGIGPAGDKILQESKARELFEKGGFTFLSQIRAGDHHYGLIFGKKNV